MDEITERLRTMYEQYPYPAGEPNTRVCSSARLVLSYGTLSPPPGGKPLQILDAGCGRGVGTLGHARINHDAFITAVDINRTGLAEADRLAKREGVDNVKFQEVDLTTLSGLDVPPGGYDLIHSSGVIHHMPDPVAGLSALKSILAPHGAIVLMVYADRTNIDRIRRAVSLLTPRKKTIIEKLPILRDLLTALPDEWPNADAYPGAELVDCFLNVNERGYDVPDFFQLIDGAGLHFLRWCQPELWDLPTLFPNHPHLLSEASRLSTPDMLRLVYELCHRPRFECILTHKENRLREKVSPAQLLEERLEVSPDAIVQTGIRHLGQDTRTEGVFYRVRNKPVVNLEPDSFTARAVTWAMQTNTYFYGHDLRRATGGTGKLAASVVEDLVNEEFLYHPHKETTP